MEPNFVNVAGLCYDIAGAVLLGRAVIFNKKEKIAQQVGSYWDYNKPLIPSVVEGRIDAVVGLGLMVAGFVLQAASTLWPGWWWELVISVVVLVIALAIYKIMLPGLVQRGSSSVIEFIEAKLKTE